jgi:hypothetical protein
MVFFFFFAFIKWRDRAVIASKGGGGGAEGSGYGTGREEVRSFRNPETLIFYIVGFNFVLCFCCLLRFKFC